MAETPEEVAVRLCGCPSCERGIHCSDADAIASALRAQYVAGMEAALAVVGCNASADEIRKLAEQAKSTQ